MTDQSQKATEYKTEADDSVSRGDLVKDNCEIQSNKAHVVHSAPQPANCWCASSGMTLAARLRQRQHKEQQMLQAAKSFALRIAKVRQEAAENSQSESALVNKVDTNHPSAPAGTEAHPPTEPASKDFGTGLRLATDVIDMHGDISNSTDDDAELVAALRKGFQPLAWDVQLASMGRIEAAQRTEEVHLKTCYLSSQGNWQVLNNMLANGMLPGWEWTSIAPLETGLSGWYQELPAHQPTPCTPKGHTDSEERAVASELPLAFHCQWPWTRKLLSGEKTMETRNYGLPAKYTNREVVMVETPGPEGRQLGVRRSVLAVVIFNQCVQYKTKDEWTKDKQRHLVEPDDDRLGWHEGRCKFGWPIQSIRPATTKEEELIALKTIQEYMCFLRFC
eukprot:CAMPEP_0114237254 /NCGR_PEP_ID=MMETSP0058-20121206/7285_1 /TAXON_ID=36894 /ORGANISM="Pyramimonas parkeae, CCMP726" /LENGTH=390 /DNA_ID=CAMNT_0001349269 /DNA_START=665 /DNA_END=1837 /DNA_ORIENTATION=-